MGTLRTAAAAKLLGRRGAATSLGAAAAVTICAAAVDAGAADDDVAAAAAAAAKAASTAVEEKKEKIERAQERATLQDIAERFEEKAHKEGKAYDAALYALYDYNKLEAHLKKGPGEAHDLTWQKVQTAKEKMKQHLNKINDGSNRSRILRNHKVRCTVQQPCCPRNITLIAVF